MGKGSRCRGVVFAREELSPPLAPLDDDGGPTGPQVPRAADAVVPVCMKVLAEVCPIKEFQIISIVEHDRKIFTHDTGKLIVFEYSCRRSFGLQLDCVERVPIITLGDAQDHQ